MTNDLVSGDLHAIFHFSDLTNLENRIDSRVLRRQANVHNVPIASNIETAEALLESWKLPLPNAGNIFVKRRAILPEDEEMVHPLEGLSREMQVIALVAHDGKKIDLCDFVVKHKDLILTFDKILATGHTGNVVRSFFKSVVPSANGDQKVMRCLSGQRAATFRSQLP